MPPAIGIGFGLLGPDPLTNRPNKISTLQREITDPEFLHAIHNAR